MGRQCAETYTVRNDDKPARVDYMMSGVLHSEVSEWIALVLEQTVLHFHGMPE